MKRFAIAFLLAVLMLSLSAQTPASLAGKQVTLEALQQRLQELQKERETVLANLHAYDGAIQETQHWITELTKAPQGEQEKK